MGGLVEKKGVLCTCLRVCASVVDWAAARAGLRRTHTHTHSRTHARARAHAHAQERTRTLVDYVDCLAVISKGDDATLRPAAIVDLEVDDATHKLIEDLGTATLLAALGLRRTVGSIDVIPPPMSLLLAAFNRPHRPNTSTKLTGSSQTDSSYEGPLHTQQTPAHAHTHSRANTHTRSHTRTHARTHTYSRRQSSVETCPPERQRGLVGGGWWGTGGWWGEGCV